MRKVLAGIAALVALIVVGGVALVASYDFEDYRGIISAEVEKATGRKLDIAGDLNLRVFSLSPAIVASELRFANAAWGSRKDMATVKRLEAVVSLPALIFGDVVVEELVLVEPDILLETNKADAGNWVMGAAAAPAGAEPAKPDEESDTGSADLPTVNRLRMEGAQITYRDGRTGRVTTIHIDEVEIESDGRTSPIEVEFVGSADGKAINISARLGSLAALLDGDGPWPVDVTAAIGDSRIAGKGELAPQAMPMRVRLAFDAARFDLGDLPGRGGGGKRLFSAEPFSLSAFRAVDAVVTAKIETLVGVTGLQFRDLEARAVMKNGTLIVNPVKARAAEGTLDASATLAAGKDAAGKDTAKLIARATLRKGKLAAAVREMTGAATLTGPFDAKAELRGTGRSLAEIMASASGYATLVSGAGRLDNKFFEFLSADVVRVVTPWAPSQAATKLRCLVVRFDITGGVGRSKVIVLDTTRATIVGEGDVNLRTERMDITFEPTTKDLSVLSVAALVPLKMVGPIDNPTVEPAVGATVTGAAKVVFGGAVDAARWVGSQLGVSSKSKKQGDPCPRARVIAGGSPPPAAASGGSPAPASKDKGVLDTIKGLFD